MCSDPSSASVCGERWGVGFQEATWSLSRSLRLDWRYCGTSIGRLRSDWWCQWLEWSCTLGKLGDKLMVLNTGKEPQEKDNAGQERTWTRVLQQQGRRMGPERDDQLHSIGDVSHLGTIWQHTRAVTWRPERWGASRGCTATKGANMVELKREDPHVLSRLQQKMYSTAEWEMKTTNSNYKKRKEKKK